MVPFSTRWTIRKNTAPIWDSGSIERNTARLSALVARQDAEVTMMRRRFQQTA